MGFDFVDSSYEEGNKTMVWPSLEKMSYEHGMEALGLYSLTRRRFRGDLIEAYKILTGKKY